MASRKLTAGGEVVSYCTKCKMDLNHRIIALVEGVPVKVECESCGSHHKYRQPKEARSAAKRTRATSTKRAPAKTPRSASARAAAAAAEEQERERLWQERIAGKMDNEFVKYTPRGKFDTDDLVHHFKFGDGYVMRVIDPNKIEVMFQNGSRVLAQGL